MFVCEPMRRNDGVRAHAKRPPTHVSPSLDVICRQFPDFPPFDGTPMGLAGGAAKAEPAAGLELKASTGFCVLCAPAWPLPAGWHICWQGMQHRRKQV